jgi:hypothetical protein
MAMDASLHTNSEIYGLNMKEVKFFDDGSGGTCFLEVSSPPFKAAVSFFFDAPPILTFIDALEGIYRTLIGEARLGLQFEEPYFSLRGDGNGHVSVSGVFTGGSENEQRLEFSFVTDQTALRPFILELKEICRANTTIAR